MLEKIDIVERFKFGTSQYGLRTNEEFLKFISIFYDEEALKQGIIKQENVVPMTYFSALILSDKDFNEHLFSNYYYCEYFNLEVIGYLLDLNCFEDGVNCFQLASYIKARWKFYWDINDVHSLVRHLTPVTRDDNLFDYVKLYWLVAKHISYYNPLQRRFTKNDEISL